MTCSILTAVYCTAAILSCKNVPDSDTMTVNSREHSNIVSVSSGRGSYIAGDNVNLSLTFNNDETSPLTIGNITVRIKNISDSSCPVVYTTQIDTTLSLNPGQKLALEHTESWKIPADAGANAFGIYIQYDLNKLSVPEQYVNFFRVIKAGDLINYRIDHSVYNDIDIYALHGGMSAECVVEKAAENLKPGIAHSWYLNAPGSGPEHVLATPQFLQTSVRETVDFYNRSLGENTNFETVIIGPGLETIPYLSFALKAPVLPLHFLASCNTVKEIQSVLDYSNNHGYASYATLGHDYSVPYAVAWVKLLDMPEEYIRFLNQHHVKNIVFTGYDGPDGENTAKKVANKATASQYCPGSLFILYPGGGSEEDLVQLKKKIIDFSSTGQQQNFIRIADWESGIIKEQLTGFEKKAKEKAGIVNTRYITAREMIHLWDYATYLSAAFYHKNKNVFSGNGESAVTGISLNPYFVTNPVFETRHKFLPFIYWQHNRKEVTVARMKNVVTAALTAYFPELQMKDLTYWINSSNNFDGRTNAAMMKNLIIQAGFNKIIENDASKDDVWDPSDGMTSPVEKRAVQLADNRISSRVLKEWAGTLQSLTLYDLDELEKKFPQVTVE